MTADAISVSEETDEATSKAIGDGLTRFNEAYIGAEQPRALWAVCRSDDGEVVGGVQAHTIDAWLIVSILWVREQDRGRGVGSRLLAACEEAARERGCDKAQLATMTFQAPAFYARLGYREIGRLEDFPEGQAYLWMAKSLAR